MNLRTNTDMKKVTMNSGETVLGRHKTALSELCPAICSRCSQSCSNFKVRRLCFKCFCGLLHIERKSGKNCARSVAFHAKKDALFAEARKNADNAVKDGVAYASVRSPWLSYANLSRI